MNSPVPPGFASIIEMTVQAAVLMIERGKTDNAIATLKDVCKSLNTLRQLLAEQQPVNQETTMHRAE